MTQILPATLLALFILGVLLILAGILYSIDDENFEVKRARERWRSLIVAGLFGMVILGLLILLDYQPHTVSFSGAPVYVGNGANDSFFTSQTVPYTYEYLKSPSPTKVVLNLGVGLIASILIIVGLIKYNSPPIRL